MAPDASHELDTAVVARRRSGRWVLVIFLVLCIAPIAASYFFYFVVKPEKRNNYGELIDPQRPVPALSVATLDGAPFDLTSLGGSWVMISADAAACPDACAKKLYEMRQIRVATGKDRERVQTVWFVTGQGQVAESLRRAYPDTLMLRADAGALADWLAASDGDASHLFLVDPHQHLMMRFPTEPQDDDLRLKHAYKVKRDLSKLLAASEIG